MAFDQYRQFTKATQHQQSGSRVSTVVVSLQLTSWINLGIRGLYVRSYVVNGNCYVALCTLAQIAQRDSTGQAGQTVNHSPCHRMYLRIVTCRPDVTLDLVRLDVWMAIAARHTPWWREPIGVTHISRCRLRGCDPRQGM